MVLDVVAVDFVDVLDSDFVEVDVDVDFDSPEPEPEPEPELEFESELLVDAVAFASARLSLR